MLATTPLHSPNWTHYSIPHAQSSTFSWLFYQPQSWLIPTLVLSTGITSWESRISTSLSVFGTSSCCMDKVFSNSFSSSSLYPSSSTITDGILDSTSVLLSYPPTLVLKSALILASRSFHLFTMLTPCVPKSVIGDYILSASSPRTSDFWLTTSRFELEFHGDDFSLLPVF